jgi:polyvinyl alcohol dehydrogenase (cytochrome)
MEKENPMRLKILASLVLALIIGGIVTGQRSNAVSRSDWPMYGRDLAGSFYNPHEKKITPATVSRLKPKWIFEAGADVSSTPTVVGGVVYFGSWDGKQYAVDAATGKKLWEYDCEVSSRSGAAYGDGVLYFGDMAARLHAVDAKTGAPKWKTKIDPHPSAVATGAPIYHQGRVYISISSHEEGAMLRGGYECCTFRGGVAAFDARTGKQIWRYYVIPEPRLLRAKTKRARRSSGPRAARCGRPSPSTRGRIASM